MDSTTDEKIVSVPYFVYEGEQTRMERINKRLVAVLIIVLLALVFTNAMWLYSWAQYDYTSEDSVVTVDSRNGVANYVGNDGYIAYGSDSSSEAAQDTPYYRQIIPAMVDYYETAHYVFVHGWIPCIQERDGSFSHRSDWREATPEEWRWARWCNGMDAAQACTEEKTILCGHWHCSYGHARYENKGSEFGPDADFSPYYGRGVIALDACTALSRKINILTLED